MRAARWSLCNCSHWPCTRLRSSHNHNDGQTKLFLAIEGEKLGEYLQHRTESVDFGEQMVYARTRIATVHHCGVNTMMDLTHPTGVSGGMSWVLV